MGRAFDFWRTLRALSIAIATLGCLTLLTEPARAMSGGDQLSDPADAPWLVTFAAKGDGPLVFRAGCGGTLVKPTKVITAAHCFDGLDPAATEAHVGAAVLSRDGGGVGTVRSVVIAPGYRLLPSPVAPDQPELASAEADVAVVTLDRPVSAPVVSRLAARRVSAGKELSFYGHGITGPFVAGQPGANRGDVLRRGILTSIDHQSCAAATPAVVNQRYMACAEDQHGTGVTACFGDSGGPLLAWRHGRPELIGVFSFAGETAGKTCGTPAPTAFTELAALRPWLLRQLR